MSENINPDANADDTGGDWNRQDAQPGCSGSLTVDPKARS
jgi:hypothetical protein